MNNNESATGEIVMYQPDETIRLEVRVENETVWLTQQQMAELFQTTRNNITLHIGNIFKEGELDDSIVRKESLLTAADGKKYKTKLYNLDVIISVGYRVKSIRGTKFRQWANSVLKQYLLKGYAVNQRIFDIEQKMVEQGLEIAHIRDKVDFFVRSSLPPIEGIFYDGQIFDAYVQIVTLIKQAKHSIVLVDNYINVDTLTMLSNRDTSVPATIDCRRCGLSVWCQPEGCRQETLCLHPNARDIACRTSEHDKIKTIREYGHNVLFHKYRFKFDWDSAESHFYALTTNNDPMKPLCRRYPIPSLQLCKEYGSIFGMSQKSPYLCIGNRRKSLR